MKEYLNVERGIDTFCLYSVLSREQKKEILQHLKKWEKFFSDSNYWDGSSKYWSNYFEEKGIKLEISQWNRGADTGWNLYVRIKPALVLKLAPWALYQPDKANYREIVKRVDRLLETVGIHESIKEMSICRIDVTENQFYAEQDDVMRQLHLLKKSMIPAKYEQVWFSKDNNTVKDAKAANKHSYKLQCKSTAFFVYDKTAQLQMIDRFPRSVQSQHILRLEVQLKRKAMLKKIGKQNSQYHELKACAQNAEKIIHWFVKRLQPKRTQTVRYADASALASAVRKEALRERMLYLLRKTSDSDNLSNALEKLKEYFQLSPGQCRNVLKSFEKLGISPITLPNTV